MFYYVYILQSEADRTRYYTGITADLHGRFRKHNAGEVPHTSKYRPWRIRVAIAFTEKAAAVAFEKYLKTHSGRVFASRHF
jgi:predicted GIY-YIG superfamily endonuclease